jgi:hypothetical protein
VYSRVSGVLTTIVMLLIVQARDTRLLYFDTPKQIIYRKSLKHLGSRLFYSCVTWFSYCWQQYQALIYGMKAKYASHRNQYPQSFWIFHVPIFHARLRLLPMSVCIVLIPIWFALEHYVTNYTYFCESLKVE